MVLVEIENLSYTYPGGIQALHEVNLRIEANQSVAITGPNGAGKSTLVKAIMGLLKPSEGKIRLFGEELAGTTTAQIAHKVGFVFQNPRMQIFLSTVKAEVGFGPQRLGMPHEEIQSRTKEALFATGLEGQGETHPYDLNPAERKLLAIASAMAMNPQILILDEPTGGMDYISSERVIQVIHTSLVQGRTVITVTHDMDLAARCADRMVVLHHGQIIADGEMRQIFALSRLTEGAQLEATAICQLAKACNLPPSLLTVEEMVEYIASKR